MQCALCLLRPMCHISMAHLSRGGVVIRFMFSCSPGIGLNKRVCMCRAAEPQHTQITSPDCTARTKQPACSPKRSEWPPHPTPLPTAACAQPPPSTPMHTHLDGVGGAHSHHIRHHVSQPSGCQDRQAQLGAEHVVNLLPRHKLQGPWQGSQGEEGDCNTSMPTACVVQANRRSWIAVPCIAAHAPAAAGLMGQLLSAEPTMMPLSRMPNTTNGSPLARPTAVSCCHEGG